MATLQSTKQVRTTAAQTKAALHEEAKRQALLRKAWSVAPAWPDPTFTRARAIEAGIEWLKSADAQDRGTLRAYMIGGAEYRTRNPARDVRHAGRILWKDTSSPVEVTGAIGVMWGMVERPRLLAASPLGQSLLASYTGGVAASSDETDG